MRARRGAPRGPDARTSAWRAGNRWNRLRTASRPSDQARAARVEHRSEDASGGEAQREAQLPVTTNRNLSSQCAAGYVSVILILEQLDFPDRRQLLAEKNGKRERPI